MISFRKVTFILLCFSILTTPLERMLYIFGINLNTLLILLTLVSGLLTIIKSGEIRKPPLGFVILYSFIGWSVITLLWTQDFEGGMTKVLVLIQLVLVFTLTYLFAYEKKDILLLFKSYIIGSVILSLSSIFSFLSFSGGMQSRFIVGGYNPNDLGYTLVFAIPLIWIIGISNSKKYLVFLPIIAFAIFLTGSRTAFLALALVVLSIICYIASQKFRFKKIIVGLSLASLYFLYTNIPQTTLGRLLTISSELSQGTLNGRTSIWDAGLSVFSESPILGAGFGSFGVSASANSILGIGEFSAHNAFLSVLVENGMIGFLLFGLFLFATIIVLFKRNKSFNAKWISLTLLLTWSLISMAKHTEVQPYTWIMLGFIWAISYATDVSEDLT